MIYALFLVCLLIFAQKGFNHFRRHYLRRNTSIDSQHLNQDEELQKFDQAGDVTLSLNFDRPMTYRGIQLCAFLNAPVSLGVYRNVGISLKQLLG